MGICFDWFKGYKITDKSSHLYDYFELEYLDGGSTSHSAGNVIKVQNLLEKYNNKMIPSVYREMINSADYSLGLIEPSKMSEMCRKVLETAEVDEVHMRDRIEWFKKLSDEGYYLAYGE